MKLQVEKLNLEFSGKEILHDISFSIQEGEFVSILGPSGCGKSTILNILAGLIEDYSGQLFVDDERIKGVRSHFAYMPQNDLLLEWRTILDNVCLYGEINHDKSMKQRALKEFETFGLSGYENAYPSSLSGGMRQRAAFLRTSLCKADILLLDEPFGALDVITRNDMQDWLLQLRKNYNRTTLLVTHDIDEALYLSDRILILSNKPSRILQEIDLSKEKKSRDWLFSQSVLKKQVYELLKGESFSVALARQGKVFPPLLINMVKTAEMTGDLPSILDDMAEYYTTMNQTRKQMKSAMTYPIVVLTIALGVLVFMLVYLVPQFASMFESQDAKLPAITLIVLGVSNFIQTNWMFLIGGVVAIILVFRYLFKHVQSFKKAVQTFLMHIPVVSKIIIYNEIANFTKTFASLINHGVFITDSMEILQKITDNEVFKGIINKTLENLSKGEPVSAAFRGEWAIPVVAYEMIVTGENTGQLGLMMEKVSAHFQSMHKSIIDQMKSLMEPLMIVFLAGIVGVILLSIVTPMFSIYSQIE